MSFFRKSQDLGEDYSRSERSSTLVTSGVSSFYSQAGQSRRLLKENLNIVQIKIISKEQYKKQAQCTVCDNPFTTTTRRQHHCRICANAVCGKCSAGTINKQRACDVCYLRWSDPSRQQRKQKLITCLQTLCGKMGELKDQKTILLRQLKKERIDPSQIVKVDHSQLMRYEQQSLEIKRKKLEVQQKANITRRRKEELERRIAQLQSQ